MLGKYFKNKQNVNSPLFAIGTGRCGTHYLDALFSKSKDVNSFHIQNNDIDSFYRYAKWYGLNIDQSPFLNQRAQWIDDSQKQGKSYFESNPYLSFHVNELFESFNSKIIFIYRNPEDVIRSHFVKGWYQEDISIPSGEKIPGIDYKMNLNHVFGRIIPKNANERDDWRNLTRAGKIAWMWNTVNREIDNQLCSIPDSNKYYLKVESLDFNKYLDLANFAGLKKHLTSKDFSDITNSKPGKAKSKYNEIFRAQEKLEISTITSELALKLGYE